MRPTRTRISMAMATLAGGLAISCASAQAATPPKYLSQLTGSQTPAGSWEPRPLAVNGSGDAYVGDVTNRVVDEFSSTGAYLSQFSGSETPAKAFSAAGLAVNGSGDVYVADLEHGVVEDMEERCSPTCLPSIQTTSLHAVKRITGYFIFWPKLYLICRRKISGLLSTGCGAFKSSARATIRNNYFCDHWTVAIYVPPN